MASACCTKAGTRPPGEEVGALPVGHGRGVMGSAGSFCRCTGPCPQLPVRDGSPALGRAPAFSQHPGEFVLRCEAERRRHVGLRVSQGWMGQQSHSRATSLGGGVWVLGAEDGSTPGFSPIPGSLLGSPAHACCPFALCQTVCCRGAGPGMRVPAQEDRVRLLGRPQGSTCDRALFRKSGDLRALPAEACV